MHAPARTAAAAVFLTLTASLAAGCSSSNGPAASATSHAPASGTASAAAPAGNSAVAAKGSIPASVPGDYVTIDPANAGRLIVGATATGAVLTTVSAPHGVIFTAVYGSGDGRAFLLSSRHNPANLGGGQDMYLLRVTSGTPVRAVMTHLPLLGAAGLSEPTAVALSPDASKVALAFTYQASPAVPQPLRVYSARTGALLRTWWLTGGMVTSAPQSGSADYVGQPYTGTSVRWLPDSRRLAFAYDSASIRLLNTTAPGKPATGMTPDGTKAQGSDLLGSSVEMISLGPTYNPGNGASFRCYAAGGWSVAADGRSVTCASELNAPGFSHPAGEQPTSCAHQPGTGTANGPATGQLPGPTANLGFTRYIGLAGQAGGISTLYAVCASTAPSHVQLAWASRDGTMVLGTVDYPGHPMFGLFSAGNFRELPPPPAGLPLTSIAW